jgi:hypothetical protein
MSVKSTALREALRGNADHALTPAEQTLMAERLDRLADRRVLTPSRAIVRLPAL